MALSFRGNIFAVPLTDTSPAANAAQLAIYRSMTGEQRLLLALEMSMSVRELNRAGIRNQHQGWTDAEINRELLRLAFLPKTLPDALP